MHPTTQPIIGVHLDLKGVMFRPSYIPQLLADLASQGVNTLLVEYEDIFPFQGLDIAWDRSVVWSRKTLATFLATAREQRLEVIPLQQCLGHLEYLFRWDRYRRFALDRNYPSTVNVTDPAARGLIFEMLEDILRAHPDSRYVHVGMDEAHALVSSAKASGRDVLDLFFDHLAALCDRCEHYGKTPLIWSDMMEDHLSPRALRRLDEFRDRVVLCPWDYTSSGPQVTVARIAGRRVSRTWLATPENPQAPTIGCETRFLEDLPRSVRKLIAPHWNGRFLTPLFQADLWSRLGFRVLGATAIRSSSHLSVLPLYNQLIANIRAWGQAHQRARLLGLIGTSWARGTTWCPPSFSLDLTWPLVAELARSLGARPSPFFAGLPARSVDLLIRTIGRCRADWRLESQILARMGQWRRRLRAHQYEWDSLRLMVRVLALQRRAEYAVSEVEFFHANHRPVDSEWQRRLEDQAGVLRDLQRLRRLVRAHFARRYHGDAFREWVSDLFDLHEHKLRQCASVCRRKLRLARRIYAQPPLARPGISR